MPPVQADPDELEHFARQLSAFTAQLRDSTVRLNGQFERLSDTWRDQRYAKFAQEYDQTIRNLHNFIKIADQQVPSLLQDARILREYEKRR